MPNQMITHKFGHWSNGEPRKWGSLGPALLTLIVMSALVAEMLAFSGGNPMGLVEQGTIFTQHDPLGTWGYDGQFFYSIARYPDPLQAAAFMDLPAYRYQRILYPLLARVLSLGNLTALPWVLIAIGLASQGLGTWAVAKLLKGWGIDPSYALIYGLWIGFVLGVRYDLPETLAFGLAAGGLLAGERDKPFLSWLLYALALFTKETTAAFVLAAALSLIAQRRWRGLAGLSLVAGLPYTLFQVWLLSVFGRIGIGSVGANTPFVWIPYWGLLSSLFQPASLLLKLLVNGVFIPIAVIPSLWGIWAGLNSLRQGNFHPLAWGLLINALAILPLPSVTFCEPRAMVRFECGLLLSTLLFVARYRPFDGLAGRLRKLLRKPLSSSQPSSLP